VPSPILEGYGSLYGVAAVSASDVWAVGAYGDLQTLIEHWDGTRWRSFSFGYTHGALGGGILHGVAAVSAGDVWAVGTNTTGTLVGHWDGTNWSIVPSPNQQGATNDELLGVAAVSAIDVWAVGDSLCTEATCGATANVTAPPEALIEHWNGTNWKVVPSPILGSYGQLDGIAAVTASNIWAVGETGDRSNRYGGFNPFGTLIEQWDGTGWNIVSGPNLGSSPGSSENELTGVAAVSASDVWAVGGSGNILGEPNANHLGDYQTIAMQYP
jgi:hypothetical protein